MIWRLMVEDGQQCSDELMDQSILTSRGIATKMGMWSKKLKKLQRFFSIGYLKYDI